MKNRRERMTVDPLSELTVIRSLCLDCITLQALTTMNRCFLKGFKGNQISGFRFFVCADEEDFAQDMSFHCHLQGRFIG